MRLNSAGWSVENSFLFCYVILRLNESLGAYGAVMHVLLPALFLDDAGK